MARKRNAGRKGLRAPSAWDFRQAMKLGIGSSVEVRECDNVYPPREDSYLLIRSIDVSRGDRVLDMGCGTGIVGLHCAKAGAQVTSVDINPLAVECARENASKNGLDIEVVLSDLFLDLEGDFDVIAFNPPYVPDVIEGDIQRSWAGGEDGVRVLERFLQEAPTHLNRHGRIYVLLSSMMRDAPLQCALSQFVRDRLLSERLFFEEIWTERLSLP